MTQHTFVELNPRGPDEPRKRWRQWKCKRCGLTSWFPARTNPHRVGTVSCDEQVIRTVMGE